MDPDHGGRQGGRCSATNTCDSNVPPRCQIRAAGRQRMAASARRAGSGGGPWPPPVATGYPGRRARWLASGTCRLDGRATNSPPSDGGRRAAGRRRRRARAVGSNRRQLATGRAGSAAGGRSLQAQWPTPDSGPRGSPLLRPLPSLGCRCNRRRPGGSLSLLVRRAYIAGLEFAHAARRRRSHSASFFSNPRPGLPPAARGRSCCASRKVAKKADPVWMPVGG